MTYHAKITEAGEIVLPADLGRQVGLKPGDSLVVEHDGATITIKPYSQVVREIQQEYRASVRPFTVDDFIADRRAEAELE